MHEYPLTTTDEEDATAMPTAPDPSYLSQAAPQIPKTEDVITVYDETVHVCRRLVHHSINLRKVLVSIARVNDGSVRAALCDTANETLTSMVEIMAEHERFMATVDSAELSLTDLELVSDLTIKALRDSRTLDLTRAAEKLRTRLASTFHRKGIRP